MIRTKHASPAGARSGTTTTALVNQYWPFASLRVLCQMRLCLLIAAPVVESDERMLLKDTLERYRTLRRLGQSSLIFCTTFTCHLASLVEGQRSHTCMFASVMIGT